MIDAGLIPMIIHQLAKVCVWLEIGGRGGKLKIFSSFCSVLSPHGTRHTMCKFILAFSCTDTFFIFSSQKAEQFLIEDMETECIFGLHVVCILAICCVVHFGDSLALYRVILALRRRQHGPSATSPSVGGKTR